MKNANMNWGYLSDGAEYQETRENAKQSFQDGILPSAVWHRTTTKCCSLCAVQQAGVI